MSTDVKNDSKLDLLTTQHNSREGSKRLRSAVHDNKNHSCSQSQMNEMEIKSQISQNRIEVVPRQFCQKTHIGGKCDSTLQEDKSNDGKMHSDPKERQNSQALLLHDVDLQETQTQKFQLRRRRARQHSRTITASNSVLLETIKYFQSSKDRSDFSIFIDCFSVEDIIGMLNDSDRNRSLPTMSSGLYCSMSSSLDLSAIKDIRLDLKIKICAVLLKLIESDRNVTDSLVECASTLIRCMQIITSILENNRKNVDQRGSKDIEFGKADVTYFIASALKVVGEIFFSGKQFLDEGTLTVLQRLTYHGIIYPNLDVSTSALSLLPFFRNLPGAVRSLLHDLFTIDECVWQTATSVKENRIHFDGDVNLCPISVAILKLLQLVPSADIDNLSSLRLETQRKNMVFCCAMIERRLAQKIRYQRLTKDEIDRSFVFSFVHDIIPTTFHVHWPIADRFLQIILERLEYIFRHSQIQDPINTAMSNTLELLSCILSGLAIQSVRASQNNGRLFRLESSLHNLKKKKKAQQGMSQGRDECALRTIIEVQEEVGKSMGISPHKVPINRIRDQTENSDSQVLKTCYLQVCFIVI